MPSMGQSGGHRGPRARRRSATVLKVLGYLLAVLVSAAAWFFLVRAAIDFGADARRGRDAGWLFMGLASIGAVGCLLLGMVLVVRALTALGLVSSSGSDHHAGKHRG